MPRTQLEHYKSNGRSGVGPAVRYGLGLTSVGIGMTELLAPKQLERTMGVGNGENAGVLRVLAVRELMHGFDLLMHKDPAPGLWARVAGDLLDGALLTAAATKTRRPSGFAMIAALVLPVVLLDMVFAPKSSRRR